MGLSLSSLFNPDPANLFGGDKGDFVNNALDPVGGFLESNPEFDPWGAAGLHEDVGAWMDDIGDTSQLLQKSRNKNLWNSIRSGDLLKREASTGFLGIGGRPDGTRLSNKINADDERPLWDMYAFFTPDDYQYAADQGQDLSNQQGLDAAGQTVGKAFINNFTGGLGSTALDAMNAYGYGDEDSAKKMAQNAGKNWLLNYMGGGEATTGLSLYEASKGDRKDMLKALGGAAIKHSDRLGLDSGMDYLKNMFTKDEEMPDVGTLGGTMQDEYGESTATMAGDTSTQRNTNLSLPTETRMQIQSRAAGQEGTGGPVEQFLTSLGIGGTNSSTGMSMGDYAGLASSVFGMYNANKQRKRLQEQQNQLANLFSANSPYAQMARQRMERKDAAAGRRSQYGARETQLAALLADRMASTMPQQQKYADAIGGYDNMMVNNGMGLGTRLYQNRGKIGQDIDSLMRLFQGGQ